MSYKITFSEKRKLKKIAKRISIQSEWHKDNVVEYMRIMRNALTEQFIEDNIPTLDGFITDCLKQAILNREKAE